MALTRDFKETVKDRADRDPEFRNELLTEALEAIVCGDVEAAKIMLRDYINATVDYLLRTGGASRSCTNFHGQLMNRFG
jgi:DNA-binding GntR family transcriptional regulator